VVDVGNFRERRRRYRPPAVLLDEAGELGAQPALENRDRLAFQ